MDNVVLVEGGVIIGLGVLYTVQNNRPVTPVFVGGVGLLLLVSLLEVLGGNAFLIGKALLSLATFSIVIAEGGNLFSGLQNALKKGQVK